MNNSNFQREAIPLRTSIGDVLAQSQPIVALGVYDAVFAALAEAAGVDLLFVGDSLGVTFQGHPTSRQVTLDQMIYHTSAVVRGSERAPVVGDLPFGSYEVSGDEAVHAALRLIKESGCQAVKMEGGGRVIDHVARVAEAGVPVIGHLVYTSPKTDAGHLAALHNTAPAKRLLTDAEDLEAAGALAVVLNGAPLELAALVTARLDIPTIGMDSGPECSGQVLGVLDVLGLGGKAKGKTFAHLKTSAARALKQYTGQVRDKHFPAAAAAAKLPEAAVEEISAQM